jgi:hypothetical protein
MIVVEKPPLNEDLLIHYGIRGMKWGVRRGKGVTGVSRHRGALMDRNNRVVFQRKKLIAGTRHKHLVGIAKKLIGEDTFNRRMKASIKELNSQNDRIKKGKITFEDRMDAIFNVPVGALVISRTVK